MGDGLKRVAKQYGGLIASSKDAVAHYDGDINPLCTGCGKGADAGPLFEVKDSKHRSTLRHAACKTLKTRIP